MGAPFSIHPQFVVLKEWEYPEILEFSVSEIATDTLEPNHSLKNISS